MNMINAGPGLIRSAGRNGTVLTPFLRPQPVRRVASPRTLLVYDNSAPSDPKISVTFGQINGMTPTLGGTALDNPVVPKLSVISGTIFLKAVINTSGVLTTLTIENAASTPANTDVNGYLTLATLTVASGVITAINHAAWNLLQMQVCGSVADEGDVTVFLWGGFGE